MGKFFYDTEEAYAEAQRRIKMCLEKRRKRLDLCELWIDRMPPEVADLKHITELKISSYKLTEIPDFIGGLVSLKKLYLGVGSTSHDNDAVDIYLPESIGKLENLQSLSIKGNFSDVPQWIGNLSKLGSLLINSDRLKTIPTEIGNLKKLQTLVIKYSGISSLLSAIGNLISLRNLEIECHEITELPAEIAQCPLVSLKLSCKKLNSLPESFKNLKKLEIFDAYCASIRKLPNYICGWESLVSFHIYWPGISAIPNEIGKLRNLKYLKIERAAIKRLPDSLADCPLEELYITGQFEDVPQAFGGLSTLRELHLCSYRLASLPESFGSLSSLEDLLISTKENIKLPESLGKLSSLRNLSLYTENMKALPDSLGSCKSLKSLHVESDALTHLPASFAKLKNIKTICLKTFYLQELPASFGRLTALESINIVSGAITKIPESLCSLKNIRYISINAYNVKELPKSFSNLSYVDAGKKDFNFGVATEKETQDTNYFDHEKNPEIIKAFQELALMGWKCRRSFLEKDYTVKEIEKLMLAMPWSISDASKKQKEVFGDLKWARWSKLYDSFKPTKKNILRVVEVSDQFLKAWEDGFEKTKKMLEAIYERESDKTSFVDKYEAKIKLCPGILYKNSKTGEWEDKDDIFQTMFDYSNMETRLDWSFRYAPATKGEIDFLSDIHVYRKLNWSVVPPIPDCFGEHYLCYTIHELFEHERFALQDIAMINQIAVYVEIECYDREMRF